MSSPAEHPPATSEVPAGYIHDLGYRPYRGPRLSEGPVAWAFCVTGLRNTYGLGLVRMQERHHRIEDVFREGGAGSVQPS